MSSSQALTPPPQEIAPPSQEMTQNLIYSTVIEVLNHPKQLPIQNKNETKDFSQTITEITDELKKILLSYLKLDPQKTATYFKSENSLLESKELNIDRIKSLELYPIPPNIMTALSRRSKINMYAISPEEQKELSKHIDRKVITYLLIRNNITKIHTVYELIAFKQFLMTINESGSKLGGRGWAISCNMGKTIDSLIAYLNTIENSTINSKIIQDVFKISDNTAKSYLARRVQQLNPKSSNADIDFDTYEGDIAEKKEILEIINDHVELINSSKITIEDIDKNLTLFDSTKEGVNACLEVFLRTQNDLHTQKELMKKNGVNIPSELTQKIDSFQQMLISANKALIDTEKTIKLQAERKSQFVSILNRTIENLSFLNKQLALREERLNFYFGYFTHLQNYFNTFREFEVDKPAIAKLYSADSSFINEVIKNILTAIYTDPLTKDALIPIIEGYDRKTQMAFLFSMAPLIGSEISFFTNPSLINLTLGYLIEGTLTSAAILDKEVLKVSSLSVFSSASDVTTLAIEEFLKNSQTAKV